MVFPHAFVIPMSREMSITQWHVPVDDTHCYWYALFTSFAAPVDKATMRAQRLASCTLPDYAPLREPRQRLGLRRPGTASHCDLYRHGHGHQRARPMGGREHGRDPGPHARSTSATSDRIITAARRLFFRAIDDVAAGRDPPLTPAPRRCTVPPRSTRSDRRDAGTLLAGPGGARRRASRLRWTAATAWQPT